MTINHFDPSELDRVDPALDKLAEDLEAYAAAASPALPLGLSARIIEAVEAEPIVTGWRAGSRRGCCRCMGSVGAWAPRPW